MKFFQGIYNWLETRKSPKWFVDLTRWLQDHVVVPTLQQIGKDGVIVLQNLVMKAKDMDATPTEKFRWVSKEFIKTYGDASKLRTSAINLGIELIYQELKVKGFIAF